MHDIAIIGGGITGAAAAYWLARQGRRVVLLEARQIAAMGSGWSLGGVRQSGRDPAELPLARAAVAMWPSLADTLGGDTEYRQQGNLRCARTPAEVETIRQLVESQRALGLELTFLPDAAAVRRLAPEIGAEVIAASLCSTDGHANPALTTLAFADAARRHGAEVREGVHVREVVVRSNRVAGIETSAGFIAARTVIVAAGLHSAPLLAPLDLTLPLTARIVNVLQTEAVAPCFAQVFGTATANCAGRQQVDGRFRLTTGIVAWDGNLETWTEASMAPPPTRQAEMRERIAVILPRIARLPVARAWGGLIDMTPDGLPVIDATPSVPGLVVAAGFCGHGFGIGPVTGRLVADLVSGATPRLDISAFRLDRFTGRSREAATPTLHG